MFWSLDCELRYLFLGVVLKGYWRIWVLVLVYVILFRCLVVVYYTSFLWVFVFMLKGLCGVVWFSVWLRVYFKFVVIFRICIVVRGGVFGRERFRELSFYGVGLFIVGVDCTEDECMGRGFLLLLGSCRLEGG